MGSVLDRLVILSPDLPGGVHTHHTPILRTLLQSSEYSEKSNGQTENDLLTIRLLGGTIVIIQFAAEKIQPVFEIQDLVVQEITWSSFD